MSALLAFLGTSPFFGGGLGAAAGGGAGLIDLYFTNTGGAGDIAVTSTTLSDIMSATVIGTAENDVLYCTAVIPAYNTTGSASIMGLTFDVDGSNVHVDKINYVGLRGGNVRVTTVKWRHVVQVGDITAGNTIVKLQAARLAGNVEATGIVNGTDGVATLSVLRVRA